MKANEFVKNEGLATAKDVVELCPLNTVEIHCNRLNVDYCFEKSELKRLIESHELVESFKCRRYSGLSNAKDHLLTLAHIEEHKQLNRLRLAISDVESCMESSK